MKRIFLLCLLLIVAWGSRGEEGTLRGGVCFRFDDNRSISLPMAAVFAETGDHFSISVNPAWLRGNHKQIAELQKLVAAGHEVMDHTPNHSGFWFSVRDVAAAEKYKQNPAVDHVIENRVYLRYVLDRKRGGKRFTGTIEKNILSGLPEDQEKRLARYLLFRESDGACYHLEKKDGKIIVRSFWRREPVDLGKGKPEEFQLFAKQAVSADLAALRLLGEASCEAFVELGFKAPVSWIQPGGFEPVLTAQNLLPVFPELGYIDAATYPGSGKKVFDAPDKKLAAFRMMWGDFNLEKEPLEAVKKKIADRVAKGEVLIASSHMVTSGLKGGMAEYLELHRQLLAWCKEKGIPVKTQREWAELLYYAN